MNLITTAHMGEAQAIIDGLRLQKVSDGVFENDSVTLLLTGEGPFEAAVKTSALLGAKSFQHIFNVGIAGSLHQDLPKEEIFEVRSSYLFLNGPQFKSFPLGTEGEDCLTSFKRILRPEEALEMKGVARLVDRELWGVAMSAKNAGVPLRSFKLISDLAGAEAICDVALESSLEWSKKLLTHLGLFLSSSTEAQAPFELEGFYFTFSAEHQFKNLMEKLRIKESLKISDLPVNEFIQKTKNQKDRTKLLIQHLEQKLDPVKEKVLSKIQSWKKPLENSGLRVDIDPKWESPAVKIILDVKNDQELKARIATLQNFSLAPYHDLLEGKLDVE